MRSWMRAGTGYQQGIPLGEVMRGGGIARVLESRAEGFVPGDVVQARLGWQTHPTLPARYLQKLDPALGTHVDESGGRLAFIKSIIEYRSEYRAHAASDGPWQVFARHRSA